MYMKQTQRLVKTILICLLISGPFATVSFANPTQNSVVFETVAQMPDFVSAPDAETIDPTFRSDVAMLAPFYGFSSWALGFHVEPRKRKKSHRSAPLLGALVLKIYFPNIPKKQAAGFKWQNVRAIVEAPILCGFISDTICTPETQPNGVLQFTSFNKKRSEGVIRFPLLPSISIRFRSSGTRFGRVQLWISDTQTKSIRTIDLKDYGVGVKTPSVPILDGVSTKGLPKSEFKKIRKLDRASLLKVMDKSGMLIAEMLLGRESKNGYARLTRAFCSKYSKLDICKSEIKIAYAWHQLERQTDLFSQGVRFQVTLRQPNSAQEIVFFGFKHGLNPQVILKNHQLEGYAFVPDKRDSYGVFENAIYDLKFVFGGEVDNLVKSDEIFGHKFEPEAKN